MFSFYFLLILLQQRRRPRQDDDDEDSNNIRIQNLYPPRWLGDFVHFELMTLVVLMESQHNFHFIFAGLLVQTFFLCCVIGSACVCVCGFDGLHLLKQSSIAGRYCMANGAHTVAGNVFARIHSAQHKWQLGRESDLA